MINAIQAQLILFDPAPDELFKIVEEDGFDKVSNEIGERVKSRRRIICGPFGIGNPNSL
jgi:hypothetical protein